jgi:Tfp pilus assembly protein PilF
MNEAVLNEQYRQIVSLIYQQRLKEAISELSNYLQGGPDWTLYSELERIRTSYNYMLQYMRQNIIDPDRNKLYTKLLADVLSVADQSRIIKIMPVSTRFYYNMRNYLLSLSPHSIKSQLMEMESYTEDIAVANLLQNEPGKADKVRERHEKAQQILFILIWTNSLWKAADEEEAQEALKSVLIPVYDICLFVSAVTMSLMECFDPRKLFWLFNACGHSSPLVNQRAMVGLAFVFQMYHQRLHLYPEIISRLSLMNEDPRFGEALNRIQIQMIRSQETVKIDKKMREEIIPEMIKSANISKMKFDFDENDEEGNDHNPDWAFNIKNSALEDKLREMSELQMEGADVYMSTFSQLKSYPFFKTIANWFYPFDKEHSSVVKELGNANDNSILELILGSGFFCDSDKYSMCFTIMHLPKMQRDAMVAQLSDQQMNMVMDEQKSAEMKKLSEREDILSNQYIHDLYRFFKLYPRRHEFHDIFNEPLKLHTYSALKPILDRPEYFRNLADYYFRKEYYMPATELYNKLLEMTGDDAELYQKIGYCLQKEKKYDQAIIAYQRADMIKPDNIWTNKHLASCYRLNKEYEKALEYYKKIEDVEPENKTLLFHMGSCLTELGRDEEALNYFFKLDFIDSNSMKTWRAIAWCSFISGKLEQAEKYYKKILRHKPQAPDYMNAGHVAWIMGNMERTIELYKKSVESIHGRQQFISIFNKDKSILIQKGIDKNDIPLMLDLI